jgi:hypothetical protein
MIRSGKLNASSYINFCFNLLKQETDVIVLEFVLKTLNYTIQKFVQFDKQNAYQKRLFSFIEEFYYSKFIDLKSITIEIMIDLLDYKNSSDMESILIFLQKLKFNKRISLLRSNSEVITKDTDFNNLDLGGISLPVKKKLVKAIFKSDFFNIKRKNNLWKVILVDHFDDKYFKYTLEACQPDIEKKRRIWYHLICDMGKDKSKVNNAYINGIFCKSQYHLMPDYFETKFFEDFITMKKNHSVEYAVKFFKNLNPSFIISQDILDKFQHLMAQLEQDDYELISEFNHGKLYIFIA